MYNQSTTSTIHGYNATPTLNTSLYHAKTTIMALHPPTQIIYALVHNTISHNMVSYRHNYLTSLGMFLI